jgi:CheY-like chemotaxis protein
MGRKILADAGYDVVTVNNGSAALKKIAELKPELVILDVYMPGYSGLEVCQRLKESQDSARIPVLLTVGKLEPFKPEEAQRVRADGYIVKPFEASELLTALTKLEDKIVPRSEPSKSGRFARAIASVEETNRNSQQIVGGDDNGWKSRIGFPHQNTEAEEKVAEEKVIDDAALYNPVNRDLRTVVETPAEKVVERIEEKAEVKIAEQKVAEKLEENLRQPELAAEATVDVAAFAPQGVPQDVTPEEVAAIAAAVAQIQTLQAALKENELAASANPSAEPTSDRQPEQLPAQAQSDQPVAIVENAAGPSPVVESGVGENIFVPAPAIGEAIALSSAGEQQDAPVTMAVAAAAGAQEGGTRWSAVSVALQGDESAISLEQEMQKAYTAFVAEEKVSAEVTTLAPVSVSQDAAAGEVVAASAGQESALTAVEAGEWYNQPEPVSAISQPAEVAAANEIPAAEAQTPQDHTSADQISANQISANQAQENPEAVAAVETVAEEPRDLVSQSVSSAAEVVAEVASLSNTVQETPTEAPSEPSAETSPSYGALAPISPSQDKAGEEESETVKTTAAAWATWRQTRDAGDSKPSTEAYGQDINVPAPSLPAPPDSAAMAVAAGAEQIAHEIAPPAGESPSDVASIVDSVLADLRPRLMAEITRKMAEKK